MFMRILIVGAGAVGGYFGARLAAAGRDVTFLVRERRAEQLRAIGLQVKSPNGDLTLAPADLKLVSAQEVASTKSAYDLILLSTKAYALEAAMEDFAPAVGAQTAILPVLNGMRHLEVLSKRFGAEHVLGGSSRIVADLDAEGRVLHIEPLQDLAFGELDKRVTPRIEAIAKTLHGAGFEDILMPDIVAFMWHKWTLLASLAGITCLLRGSIGEIARVPFGIETEQALLHETAAIASASGYTPPEKFLAGVMARLTDPQSTLTASMYRDLTKNSPVEADHVLGDLLRRGKALGLESPLLQAAYVALSVYSARQPVQ
jgi:2-dehydropantoate 2-reductase